MASSDLAFPQADQNRSVAELTEELATYVGGPNLAKSQDRAQRSLDAAVRKYNRKCWTFNRVIKDITLAIPDGETNYANAYEFASDLKAVERAVLHNSAGRGISRLRYVAYPEYVSFYEIGTQGTTSTEPRIYTFRNRHETGEVLYWPPFGTAVNYPTVQHTYFRRIVRTQDNDRLNVPEEVEEAIFRWALYDLIKKERGGEEAKGYWPDARDALNETAVEYQAFPDIPLIGVGE